MGLEIDQKINVIKDVIEKAMRNRLQKADLYLL